jgi:hypothetical protein
MTTNTCLRCYREGSVSKRVSKAESIKGGTGQSRTRAEAHPEPVSFPSPMGQAAPDRLQTWLRGGFS